MNGKAILGLCLDPLSLLTVALYSMAHPYILAQVWRAGFHKETINIFGLDMGTHKDILFGRALFYGCLGAFIYSFQLTWRHYLTYDLTPSVYIFSLNHFMLAAAVGAVISMVFGTYSAANGRDFNTNLAKKFQHYVNKEQHGYDYRTVYQTQTAPK